MSFGRSALSSVRLKVVATVLVVLAVYALLDHMVERLSILSTFRDAEYAEAIREMHRCRQAIERELRYLSDLAQDWAGRRAVPDGLGAESGAATDSRPRGRVSLVARLGPPGDRRPYRARDLRTGATLALDAMLASPGDRERLLSMQTPRAMGLLTTTYGVMLLAVEAMPQTDRVPDASGRLLLARLIDDELLADLRSQTRASVAIEPVRGMDDSGLRRLSMVRARGGVLVEESGRDVLRLFCELSDVFGNPCAVLRVEIPRQLMAMGVDIVRSSLTSTFGAAGLVLFTLLALLGRLVVRPLSDLARQVTAIRSIGAGPVSIGSSRSDEIGLVADAFDSLLERLAAEAHEREQSAAALRESEAKVRAILSAAPDGVLSLDASGRVESANPAALRLLGAAQIEALLGRPITEIWTSGNPTDATAEVLAGAQTPTGGFSAEVKAQRDDGSSFPARVTVQGYDSADRRGYTAVLTDLTEVRRLNEEMVHARRLAAIGEMGAMVAHEIRNPLAAISSALQMVCRQPGLPDTLRPLMDEVLDQVRRADLTVQHLLLMSGPWRPDRTLCDLRALVQRAWDNLANRGETAGVCLTHDSEGGALAPVDEHAVSQVFWNLLRNAVQAMPDGGGIRLQCWDNAETAGVRISDSGSGLTDADLAHAFEPFYSMRALGTGLGLAFSKRVVQAHGGRIALRRGTAGGAVVEIEFPKEVGRDG